MSVHSTNAIKNPTLQASKKYGVVLNLQHGTMVEHIPLQFGKLFYFHCE
jgi:hypothetical protein